MARRQIGFIPGIIPEKEDKYVGKWVILTLSEGSKVFGRLNRIEGLDLVLNPFPSSRYRLGIEEIWLKPHDKKIKRKDVIGIEATSEKYVRKKCREYTTSLNLEKIGRYLEKDPSD